MTIPQYAVRNPVSSSSRVNVVRLRDSSGRFLPRSDSHQSAHEESENSSRSEMNQGLLLGMDSQSVLMRQVVL